MTSLEESYGAVAAALEAWAEEHMWDPYGIMYAYLDGETGKPFPREFITPIKVPPRADFNPWAFWTYEDSICHSGHYLSGHMYKYQVTADPVCLERADRAWQMVKNIYYASQIYGSGCFLRPYGGYDVMGQFMEPLGTDQAAPLFHGLYHYMKQVDDETRAEITEVMLKTLGWYEQQNFRYFYYKRLIHHWEVHLPQGWQHAGSYYLPALAWAAQVTGERKWQDHLERGLALFQDERYNLFATFTWGSDLPVLAEILGERFGDYITPAMVEVGYRKCQAALAEYEGPKMVKRAFPESAEPGFQPYMTPGFDRETASGTPFGLGFAYICSVHGGRLQPHQDYHFLCGLALLGYPGAYEQAVEVLQVRRRVPEDFTYLLWEDYEQLPEAAHLYARVVGNFIVEWWRNYWMLRSCEAEGR